MQLNIAKNVQQARKYTYFLSFSQHFAHFFINIYDKKCLFPSLQVRKYRIMV